MEEKLESSEDMTMETATLDLDAHSTMQSVQKGAVIEGTVVMVDNESVWVNVGYKSEGKILLEEFDTPPVEGEKFPVVVLTTHGKSGELVVSKKRALSRVMRKTLEDAFETGALVSGKIVKEAKGGMMAEFDGVPGYVPLSHLELSRVQDPKQYIGKIFDFKIIKVDKGKNFSVVASRRDILSAKREEDIQEVFSRIKEKDVIEGTVSGISRFGVFVDIGGMDGLISLGDLSWNKQAKASSLVSIGDKVKVKILKINTEKHQVSLSLKDLEPDPIHSFSEAHNVGDVVEGKVVKLENFGAFVSLAGGIEGLLHISELSWTKKINHPKQVLETGSEIQVKILGIDKEKRRISLGFRQLLQNPFDSIEEDFPLASKHTGKIVNITEFGIFVELSNGIEGLVRKEDLSWDKKDNDAKKQFSVEDMVEVQILSIDKKNKKIGLGIKQLEENPLAVFSYNNPPGSKMTGKVTRVSDFGAFVELSPGIEGLVHISKLSNKKVDKVEEVVKVGDSVNVKLLNIDMNSSKISLSIKDYNKDVEKELVNQYKSEDKGTFRLGDMIDLSSINNKGNDKGNDKGNKKKTDKLKTESKKNQG